jgi:hypothetical protein
MRLWLFVSPRRRLVCGVAWEQVCAVFWFHQREESVASWTSYGKADAKKSKATTW